MKRAARIAGLAAAEAVWMGLGAAFVLACSILVNGG